MIMVTLIAMLILNANGVVIPVSAWVLCGIYVFVNCFVVEGIKTYKKDLEKRLTFTK